MCLIFTCGEHTFRKQVEGYEGLVCQCHNCGNYSGHVIKSHPWFTFCFIPALPLSIHGYVDVVCNICNFSQPLEQRQDVQSMKRDVEGGAVPSQQQPQKAQGAPQGPPQGWGGQAPPVPSAPSAPPEGQQPMRYG